MSYKRYKTQLRYSYSIGVYPTIELLEKRPMEVQRVLLSTKGGSNKGIDIIKQLCNKAGIETVTADAQIRKLANEKTYAIGVFEKYTSEISQTHNHIVLVRPKHQGNLGTIIRTMVGFGFHDLAIIGESADIFHPNTIRASMGSFFGIRFQKYPTIREYVDDFPDHNLYPFMTSGRAQLRTVTFETPFSLIFGNEGEGLADTFTKIGTPVRIEQFEDVDSLNLAVSASIAMYQAIYHAKIQVR